MSRNTARRTRAITSLLVLLAAGLMAAAPTAAHHSWWMEVGRPAEAMEFSYGPGYANLTFGSPSTMLVGYHEEREVVSLRSEYGSTLFLDLETGRSLGWGSEGTYQRTWSVAGVPLPVAFADDHRDLYAPELFHAASLPETLLWGRFVIFSGEAWEVPADEFGGVTREASVRVGDVAAGVADVEVTWRYRWTPHDVTVVLRWDLTLEADHAFASERRVNVTMEEADGNTTYYDEDAYPIEVLSAGGAPLAFQGRSELSIVDGRDRTFTYGTMADGLPYDPRPYRGFDVRAVAAQALDLDLEAVRVFRAAADDPHLASASYSASTVSSWTLTFTSMNGRGLRVHMSGEATPAGFVPVTADATSDLSHGSYVPASQRAALETAGIGDVLRVMEGAVGSGAARDLRWDLGDGYFTPKASIRGGFSDDVVLQWSHISIETDLETAIVAGSMQTDGRVTLP